VDLIGGEKQNHALNAQTERLTIQLKNACYRLQEAATSTTWCI